MSKRKLYRLDPDARAKMILDAAVELSNERGIWGWSVPDVADRCEVPTSVGTIKRYWGGSAKRRLQAAVHMRRMKEDVEAKGLLKRSPPDT